MTVHHKAPLPQPTRRILFIDDIHTVTGPNAQQGGGVMDASILLKPLLSRGELRCIGATTLDKYRKFIEKDPALERRFQQVCERKAENDRPFPFCVITVYISKALCACMCCAVLCCAVHACMCCGPFHAELSCSFSHCPSVPAFSQVSIDPPDVTQTISILRGIRLRYERHHSVRISDKAIQAAATLSDRYIPDRFLPDKVRIGGYRLFTSA